MPKEVDEMLPKVIGEKITRLMSENSLNRKAVAEYCGVTDQTVWFWMTGQRIPSDDMKLKLSKLLKRSVKFLFFTP